jgi:hypothetical protein
MDANMRNFWPFATLLLVFVIASLYTRDRVGGCDTVQDGGKLHLYRNVDTTRARFCYAADCRLIAEQMNKVERAHWSCD